MPNQVSFVPSEDSQGDMYLGPYVRSKDPCRLCGCPIVPYKSRGAELGDVNLCSDCVERAMGRPIPKAAYNPKLMLWIESVKLTRGGP